MSRRQAGGQPDEELLARLRHVAAQADPAPAALLAAARAAFALREAGARVAGLVRDSAVDAPVLAVRGPGARMLSFDAAPATIECEVSPQPDGTREVSGQLAGAVAASVAAQVAGYPPAQAQLGAHGWFTVRGLPPGPLRLRIALAGGGAVVTSWTLV